MVGGNARVARLVPVKSQCSALLWSIGNLTFFPLDRCIAQLIVLEYKSKSDSLNSCHN